MPPYTAVLGLAVRGPDDRQQAAPARRPLRQSLSHQGYGFEAA